MANTGRGRGAHEPGNTMDYGDGACDDIYSDSGGGVARVSEV
tara:strand:+ start:3214 stop:3339 length:126 start_codon:yes stop_codon:yes gene_type:complete